jgi:exodeoxyribonuclease VII small subunit
VSKNPVKKPVESAGSDPGSLPFESALKRLDEIVTRLETGELPLEESLKLYEEGVSLSRLCHAKLEEAEGRIELLTKDARGALVPGENGRPRTTPFQPEEGAGREPSDDVPF